jgi:hypothetical protein
LAHSYFRLNKFFPAGGNNLLPDTTVYYKRIILYFWYLRGLALQQLLKQLLEVYYTALVTSADTYGKKMFSVVV